VNTDTHAEGRFEDRLLTAILDDFDHLVGAADGVRPARHRRAVTTVAAGAVAAAAVVTAGTVAVTGAVGPGLPHRNTAAGAVAHGPASPGVQTAAYVVNHMRSALDANTAVVNIIDHAPDSATGKPVVDESWSSSHSDTYRIEDLNRAGQPVTGYLVTITAHRTVSIVINYRARTWTRTVYPFGSASSARSPAPRGGTPLQMAAQLRAEVRAGRVTLAGRDTVDGQRAIHLTQRSAQGLLSMWVSPSTYLPIRTIGTAPGVSPDSPKAIRDDYRWLPATPANLRLLTAAAAIPAGFTQTGGAHGR
jgi:hypothetical protein